MENQPFSITGDQGSKDLLAALEYFTDTMLPQTYEF